MTEEIIIDGVNVAGCQCFENDKCLWCKKYYENNATPNCKEVKDCYYKQLTRLEQENKELKAYKDINEDFKKAWDELNKKYAEVLKLAKENADSNEYCLQELEQKYEKMRSALEEIRNLCNKGAGVYTNAKVVGLINEVLND